MLAFLNIAPPPPPFVCRPASGDDQFRPRWSVTGRCAPASRELSAAKVATACVPGERHKPARKRVDERRYWLYEAAWDGCLTCVRHFLEDEHVDPDSRSHSQGYTVLDWAVWAREKGRPGADAVEEYLRARWPQFREITSPSPASPSPPIVFHRASGDDQFPPQGVVSGRCVPAAQASSAAEVATPCVLAKSHKPARQRPGDKASHGAPSRHAPRQAKARPCPRGSVASVVACSDGARSASSDGASSANWAPPAAALCIECGSRACREGLIAPWGVRTCGRLCKECEIRLFRPDDWTDTSDVDFVE